MEFLSQFLEMMLAERAVANNSLLSYKRDLLDFQVFLNLQKLEASIVRTENIIDFVKFLANNHLQARSIHRKLSTIKIYYDFLISEGHINCNPTLMVDLPKFHSKLPTVLSVEDIRSLLLYSSNNQSPEGLRFSAMISLLYSTGLRVSELVSLKLIDILINQKSNEVRKVFTIYGKGNKERSVITNQQSINSLLEYLKIRDLFIRANCTKSIKYLFPSSSSLGHMTRQNFAILLKKAAIQIGLDANNVSPHALRHSFATHLLEGGADLSMIRELLGHADISSTQIYTNIQTGHLAKTLKRFHPLNLRNGSDLKKTIR
jgi:integrase/recombinase XerD